MLIQLQEISKKQNINFKMCCSVAAVDRVLEHPPGVAFEGSCRTPSQLSPDRLGQSLHSTYAGEELRAGRWLNTMGVELQAVPFLTFLEIARILHGLSGALAHLLAAGALATELTATLAPPAACEFADAVLQAVLPCVHTAGQPLLHQLTQQVLELENQFVAEGTISHPLRLAAEGAKLQDRADHPKEGPLAAPTEDHH